MRYWLYKSEPGVYGIDHLERDGTTIWDGVRNYHGPHQSQRRPRSATWSSSTTPAPIHRA